MIRNWWLLQHAQCSTVWYICTLYKLTLRTMYRWNIFWCYCRIISELWIITWIISELYHISTNMYGTCIVLVIEVSQKLIIWWELQTWMDMLWKWWNPKKMLGVTVLVLKCISMFKDFSKVRYKSTILCKFLWF